MNNKEVQDSLKQVGIRMVEEPPLLSPEPMNSPEAAVRVLGKWLSEMDRELFCVVNLNTNLTPINMNVVSMGALNEAYVHPRETLKSAILSNSAYLMLVHNHLGSLNPSKEDITLTDRIQSAASIMGIPVLDHIIVGRNQEFFSLRENNVFSFENDMSYTSELSKLQWTQQMNIAERSAYRSQGKESTESKLDTIMKSLEEGVEKVFTSEQYQMYLQTMTKFHNYSFNNTLLIAMQRPDATLVAGYQTWQKKFKRHVNRGEKGIKIIAPVPVKEKHQVEKIDEETQEIVIGVDGQPETETVERILSRFRVTTVFDVSQTDGEPLPTLEVNELTGDVIIYEDFMKGLEEISPVPFRFQEIDSGAKGYYTDKLIAIQSGMSNAQTMKTAVHETTHAILHDRDVMEENGIVKDRMTKEVEAESVAYIVCNHFGLDTSDYSFGYIASWSSGKEMSELRNSMDTIRTSSSQLITDITDRLQELQKNREQEKTEDVKVINSEGIDFNTDADPQGTGGIKVADERILFTKKEDFYAIYQYDHTDGNWGYEFMGLDFAEKMGMIVDGKDYRLMYLNTLNKDDTLDQLFMKFNIDRPNDFEGHSLSTSDVIIMKHEGELKAYYVDSIGFKELPNFVLQRANLLNVSIKSEYPPVYMETFENEIKKLAVDLDNFSYDYDPYVYNDNVENKEEQVEKIVESIMNHDIEGFKEWLTSVTEESAIDSEVRSAYSLLSRLENAEKNFTITKVPEQNHLSFYVAECMEFPTLGEFYENLTLEEAIRIYENIPADRMNGIKGIGFELKDGSDYEGTYELMHLGKVDRENVEMIQHYKKNPDIQKALDVLEKYCEEKSLSKKNVPEIQQNLNRKKKQQSIQRGLYR